MDSLSVFLAGISTYCFGEVFGELLLSHWHWDCQRTSLIETP
jgi:hypothetical protein